MPDSNPYRPIRAEVLDVVTETPTIKTIRFKPDEAIRFQTGQFVEITIPGVGEAPFTPSSRPSIGETMEVSVMKVGKVTEEIHQLSPGEAIGVRGPLGCALVILPAPTEPDRMSTGRLHGAKHPKLGEIATLAEGPAAIAISRGGSKKRYAYRDPNEDAAGFALSNWGGVVVVADGHNGHQAAQIAVDRVLDKHAPRWLGAAPIALDARFLDEAASANLEHERVALSRVARLYEFGRPFGPLIRLW